MQFSQGTLKTADGLALRTVAWTPAASAKAAIVIAHGLAEHIGRYEHVAQFFVDTHGYAVYGIDHRGHGQSQGLRTYFDSFDQPVADFKRYVDTLKPQHSKLFLYGHSMGSLIALLYVLKYPQDFAALVSTGTPLDADTTVAAPVIALATLLDKIIPKVNFLPLDSSALSHDAAVVAAYDADPLVDRKPTRIHMGMGIMHGAQEVKRRLAEITLPLLILHGGADKICPPSGSRVLHNGAGAADKTLHIYDGLYHEIHNEKERGEVLARIAAWLAAR